MRYFAAVALVLVACAEDKPKSAPDVPGAFPGHAPPALAELLAAATATPATGTDITYDPQPVTVPPLEPLELSVLPEDEEGRPILSQEGTMALVVDENLSDPITAKGDCLSVVSGCLQPPDVPSARNLDSCFASAPRCTTNQPWAQESDCCPSRCQELYRGLRQQDYPQLQAFELTATSACFPGLTEFLQVNQ
jgi:hypothetical protein